MNRFILFFIILTLIPLNLLAADTVTFRIRVTIPARLEFKTPASHGQEDTQTAPSSELILEEKESEENTATPYITTTGEIMREGKLVLVKTIVAR